MITTLGDLRQFLELAGSEVTLFVSHSKGKWFVELIGKHWYSKTTSADFGECMKTIEERAPEHITLKQATEEPA